jgi:hypothetical protein
MDMAVFSVFRCSDAWQFGIHWNESGEGNAESARHGGGAVFPPQPNSNSWKDKLILVPFIAWYLPINQEF